MIVVGGGVMGSAIATCLLKADPQAQILVIERDPPYTYTSTVLSDGNIRVQHPLFQSANCVGVIFGWRDGSMSPLDVLLS